MVEGCFGIVTFCDGQLCVSQYELYLLHAQAVLVEEGGAGVSCQVPVQVECDSRRLCHLPQRVVGGFVVAYVCEVLQGAILVYEFECPALP